MSIIDYDLPQGTASNTPVSSAVSYCGPSDVAALNKARVPGVGNNPTLADIQTYIAMTAGQINAVLAGKGYSIPINAASSPEAEGLLAWVNATGAAWMVEEASPNAPNVDRAKAAFDLGMKMLSDAKFVLNAAEDEARGEVRAPFVTFQPPFGVYDPMDDTLRGVSGDGISGGAAGIAKRQLPFFTRGLRF